MVNVIQHIHNTADGPTNNNITTSPPWPCTPLPTYKQQTKPAVSAALITAFPFAEMLLFSRNILIILVKRKENNIYHVAIPCDVISVFKRRVKVLTGQFNEKKSLYSQTTSNSHLVQSISSLRNVIFIVN